MILCFIFAMKQTSPQTRVTHTECRKKAPSYCVFCEFIEHFKINKVGLVTRDFIQMVKEKRSGTNEVKEMKEAEREVSRLIFL